MRMIPYFLEDDDGAVVTTDKDGNPKEVHITISGDPRPLQCPRYHMVNGRVVMYNPDQSIMRIFQRVLTEALGQRKDQVLFLEGSFFSLNLQFNVLCPPSHFTSGGNLKPGVPLFPRAGGGVDNYNKFVLDAIKSIIYVDDKTVTCLISQKKFADNNQGKTIIVVTKIN